MSYPVVARPRPYLVRVKAGRMYFWCRCGRSANQPFCDGSHRGTGFEPLRYVAGPQDEDLLFCGCKDTRSAPFCDGAHNNLPGGSPLDDPLSPANRAIPTVERRGPRALLNSGYVFSPGVATMLTEGALRYCYLVTAQMGATHQTQVLLELPAGQTSPVMSLDGCELILFVAAGSGMIEISGRDFPVAGTDGVYVRPGEAIRLKSHADALRVFALGSPGAELHWPAEMPLSFDSTYAQRVVSVDPAQRVAMGSRYFQLLVDKRIGSRVITQFIGHVPCSKAAPHRHLYEEAIIVLRGEGYMWTEDRKARVAAGDVVFLPSRQLHSLEATSADGIDVVGVICPGDNPSINYYD
ncbi:MAG TPA: CDGSH iron-sulfur domain-containing protein [Steroidobacteraceae bacterium]|nr:CDGSH iron-sulfur domain-containing protein [Steroidobacteraceae bacterium]